MHDYYQTSFLDCLSSFESIKEYWHSEIKAETEGVKEKALSILNDFPEDTPPEKKLKALEDAQFPEEVLEMYREELKPKTIFNKLFH